MAMWKSMGLSSFSAVMAQRFVGKVLEDPTQAAEFHSVAQWLRGELSRAAQGGALPAPASPWQSGCPERIPGLAAKAVWCLSDVPALETWATEVLAPALPAIQAELQGLREEKEGTAATAAGFQEYRAPAWADKASAGQAAPQSATSAGQWNVFYLHLHDVDMGGNRERCPTVTQVLQSLPGAYHHALISAMAPGTHITPHCGPTNKKLRLQIPLLVPDRRPLPASQAPPLPADTLIPPPSQGGCGLRAGDSVVEHAVGVPVLFDDSHEHEAWNWNAAPRVILIADVWHPDLTPVEVKFLTFLGKAQQRAARALSKALASEGDTGADFYSLLEAGLAAGAPAAAVLGPA